MVDWELVYKIFIVDCNGNCIMFKCGIDGWIFNDKWFVCFDVIENLLIIIDKI